MTEKAKAAIKVAAKGLGYDTDIGTYLSSMIESDRGITRTLKQTFYGDEENGFAPNKLFVKEMTENYPDIWKVAQGIEGLKSGVGVHAGGVIFNDEDFTNSIGLMRSPEGTLITCYDLHNSEDCGLIKIDLLSIDALDKIHVCLDLLTEAGHIAPGTLRERYERTIGIYNLERNDPKMWQMIWERKVPSLFQMEKQSGISGIAATHPESVEDLATLNSVIRLMAQERGGEQPLDKYVRFKNNPKLWDEEMDKWGLTQHEKEVLQPIVGDSYGICESQER